MIFSWKSILGCPDYEAEANNFWLALTPAASIDTYDELARLNCLLRPHTIVHFGIEFNFSSKVGIKCDILYCSACCAMPDTNARYDLIFRHFKTTFKLITGRWTECTCVYTIFEVQLKRPDCVINSASYPMNQSLRETQSFFLHYAIAKTLRIFEF